MAEKDLVAQRGDNFGEGGDTALESRKLLLKDAREKEESGFFDELLSTRGILQGLMTAGAFKLGGAEAGAYMGLQQLSGAEGRSRASSDEKDAGILSAKKGVITAQEAAHQRNLQMLVQQGDRFTKAALIQAEGDPDYANELVAKLTGTFVGADSVPDYVGAMKEQEQAANNREQAATLYAQLENIPTLAGRAKHLALIDSKLGHTLLTDEEYLRAAQHGIKPEVLFDRLRYATIPSSGAALAHLQENPDDIVGAYMMLEDTNGVGSGGTTNATAMKFQAEVDAEAKVVQALIDWRTLHPGEKMPNAREIILNTVNATDIGTFLHGEDLDTRMDFYNGNVFTDEVMLEVAKGKNSYEEVLRHQVLTNVITQEQADQMADAYIPNTLANYAKGMELSRQKAQVDLLVGGVGDVMDVIVPGMSPDDVAYSLMLSQVQDAMTAKYIEVGGVPLDTYSALETISAVAEQVAIDMQSSAPLPVQLPTASVGADGGYLYSSPINKDVTDIIDLRAKLRDSTVASVVGSMSWDGGPDEVKSQILKIVQASHKRGTDDPKKLALLYREADQLLATAPDIPDVEGSPAEKALAIIEYLNKELKPNFLNM